MVLFGGWGWWGVLVYVPMSSVAWPYIALNSIKPRLKSIAMHETLKIRPTSLIKMASLSGQLLEGVRAFGSRVTMASDRGNA